MIPAVPAARAAVTAAAVALTVRTPFSVLSDSVDGQWGGCLRRLVRVRGRVRGGGGGGGGGGVGACPPRPGGPAAAFFRPGGAFGGRAGVWGGGAGVGGVRPRS